MAKAKKERDFHVMSQITFLGEQDWCIHVQATYVYTPDVYMYMYIHECSTQVAYTPPALISQLLFNSTSTSTPEYSSTSP